MRRSAATNGASSAGHHSSQRRRRRKKPRPAATIRITCGSIAVVGITSLVVALTVLWLTTTAVVLRDNSVGERGGGGGGATDAGADQAAAAGLDPEEPRALRRRHEGRQMARHEPIHVPVPEPPIGGGSAGIQPAPTNQVVATLLRLARMPSKQLRQLLEPSTSGGGGGGGGDGDVLGVGDPDADPFRMTELQKGQCPWRGEDGIVIEWLPQRPLLQTSEWFRNRGQQNANNDNNRQTVAVYYEHLSKAGGTSFCKLAQSNMPKAEVPKYYCMPSEPGMPDARIGSWTVDKLKNYFKQKPHRLVSNGKYLDLQRNIYWP